jgi:hypothetical protein
MNKQLELTRGNVVKNVFEIKESDFYNVVMQSKENYFVLFYGDLCYFDKQCQQLYTVMNELHIEYINKVNFAAFNYMNTNVISFESEVALPSVLAFMKGKKQKYWMRVISILLAMVLLSDSALGGGTIALASMMNEQTETKEERDMPPG